MHNAGLWWEGVPWKGGVRCGIVEHGRAVRWRGCDMGVAVWLGLATDSWVSGSLGGEADERAVGVEPCVEGAVVMS